MEEIDPNKQLIWEYRNFPIIYLLMGLITIFLSIVMVPFGVLLIYGLIFGLFPLDPMTIFIIIFGLIIFFSPIMFFIQYLYGKDCYSIEFSNKSLKVKKGFTGIKRLFDLLNIISIKIILKGKREWYRKAYHAKIRFNFIITTNQKEKVYSFCSIFSKRSETIFKSDIKSKKKVEIDRDEFIDSLYNLKNLFPNLISVEEDPTARIIDWDFWCGLSVILFVFSLPLIYNMILGDMPGVFASGILIGLCLCVMICARSIGNKKQRKQREELYHS